jgi:hypothetical protein
MAQRMSLLCKCLIKRLFFPSSNSKVCDENNDKCANHQILTIFLLTSAVNIS